MSAPAKWKQYTERVADSTDAGELERDYDDWSGTYDVDHLNFGNKLLVHFTGVFCRHVPVDASPILDAGAGTGRLAETLTLHGYRGFTGIDLSANMLAVASAKGVYDRVHRMRLGDRLDFEDNRFAVVASLAAMSPGHAGADAFEELIRITKPGGLLVLSLRAGCESITGFDARRVALEKAGQWRLEDQITDFESHPEYDPPLRYGVHVYRIPD